MRRILAFVALAAIMGTTAPASADLPGENWRARKCRFARLDDHAGFTRFEVRSTIRCAIRHWSVPGGVSTAFCYAEHESGFNEFAANSTSSASGVYQTVDGTWDTIRTAHPALVDGWRLPTDAPGRHAVYHARTHVVLVIRYVAAHGWGPWANFAAYSC